MRGARHRRRRHCRIVAIEAKVTGKLFTIEIYTPAHAHTIFPVSDMRRTRRTNTHAHTHTFTPALRETVATDYSTQICSAHGGGGDSGDGDGVVRNLQRLSPRRARASSGVESTERNTHSHTRTHTHKHPSAQQSHSYKIKFPFILSSFGAARADESVGGDRCGGDGAVTRSAAVATAAHVGV